MLFVPADVRERLREDRLAGEARRSRVLGILQRAGLRSTRQRMAVGGLLFGDRHRHVTAESVHRELIESGARLSLATVYNTLNQFSDAGLIRRIAAGGGRTHFDTDTGDHRHFFIEAEGRILDMPPGSACLGKPPTPPPGYEITGVDLVVRLRAGPSGNCGRGVSADRGRST